MPDRSPRGNKPVDAIYEDPSLIPLYDVLNSADHDHLFYREEIGPDAERVIDLGCGTGRFARDLARRGYRVVALDPAPAMIEYARKQDTFGTVEWVTGTASDIPVEIAAGTGVDAVTMMGHAFQCLLADDDIRETFAAVRSALRNGGRFLFESRNPAITPWTAWNGNDTVSGAGLDHAMTVERNVLGIDGDLVHFEETFRLPERTVTSRSTLRFLDKETIAGHLRAAGFEDITVFGFWDRRPFTSGDPEMIFSAA